MVSEMEIQNVEDDDELHDLDLISGDTCKGDPPPEPKRKGFALNLQNPTLLLPSHLLRMLIVTCFLRLLRKGSSREKMQLALCSPAGPKGVAIVKHMEGRTL